MKAKREKEIKAKKQMEADQAKAKIQLKDRLMALDLKAINAAAKVLFACSIKGRTALSAIISYVSNKLSFLGKK